jgi:plasmid stabilization system protein ParE
MAADVIYAPEAEQDISDGYEWYEDQSPGLGEEFLRAVDACISAIARSPKAHQAVYKTYRRGVVRKFPYVVFYEEDGNTVTIYCVFHASQDPDKWRKRLS